MVVIPKRIETEQENISDCEQLLEYQKQGCVFHGSPDPNITELEPRPANDVDKSNTENNDTAVFAARLPATSVIFACMSFEAIPTPLNNDSWGISVDTDDKSKKIIARIPTTWQPYITSRIGYVYVLDGKDFSGEGDFQVKSKKIVKPMARIEVSFSDFEKLGGIIIWE